MTNRTGESSPLLRSHDERFRRIVIGLGALFFVLLALLGYELWQRHLAHERYVVWQNSRPHFIVERGHSLLSYPGVTMADVRCIATKGHATFIARNLHRTAMMRLTPEQEKPLESRSNMLLQDLRVFRGDQVDLRWGKCELVPAAGTPPLSQR